MEKRARVYSHEDYWEAYHKDAQKPVEEKNLASYKYDSKLTYWLDYYEERTEFALTEMESHLKHAQKRKEEQEFELKLFGGIALGILLFLPISLALPLSGILPLMIIGGVLVIIEILALAFGIPICIYKIVRGFVSKVINDKDNSLGDWIVQRYHVPRLTAEIQACQTYVGRYKEQLANIASWREMLEQGAFEMEETELKNRMERVNLDPKIETALANSFRLKRLITRTTIVVVAVVFGIVIALVFKGYMDYYNWFLSFWESV